MSEHKTNKQTDTDELLQRLDLFLAAAEKARGTAGDLQKAAPLELHLYNIATATKRELEGFRAMLQDFRGEYLKGKV